MPLKLDVIVWDDHECHIFVAVAVTPAGLLALGKIADAGEAARVPALPMPEGMYPQEFLSHIPKDVNVHYYDKEKNTFQNLRDGISSLQ